MDGLHTFTCKCAEGYSGPDCSISRLIFYKLFKFDQRLLEYEIIDKNLIRYNCLKSLLQTSMNVPQVLAKMEENVLMD